MLNEEKCTVIDKIGPQTLALFMIMTLPFFGYFVEGNITISSCLASILAFFLIVVHLVNRPTE